MKIILILIITLLMTSCSEDVRDVPKELFNIKLGMVYDFSKMTKESVGEFPIRKFIGTESSIGGIGTHLYFEPKTVSNFFPNKEKEVKDNFNNSNYDLYLIPIIPSSIKTIKEITESRIEMEVALIKWSDDKKDKNESYYWAKEMCKTFTADMKTMPKIWELAEHKDFICDFIKDNRVLTIKNIANSVYFSLGYQDDVIKKKEENIEKIINKIKAREIIK